MCRKSTLFINTICKFGRLYNSIALQDVQAFHIIRHLYLCFIGNFLLQWQTKDFMLGFSKRIATKKTKKNKTKPTVETKHEKTQWKKKMFRLEHKKTVVCDNA